MYEMTEEEKLEYRLWVLENDLANDPHNERLLAEEDELFEKLAIIELNKKS